MPGRLVLFGATGYTGDLTARALVARGSEPVLAGRNAERLAALAAELGGLETAVADVAEPAGVQALVQRGDVLISTVGPFLRWGEPAVRAAIAAGAHYLDSTGEGAFIRQVFERFGPEARAAGSALVPAFGYDWVPGNLAGALALREAGEPAKRVDVGYFAPGGGGFAASGGTRASSVGIMLEPGFAWRGGRLVEERIAAHVRSFRVRTSDHPAVSVPGSEHLALPRVHQGLRDVGVYLGWFGELSRPMQALSFGVSAVTRIPGAKAAVSGLLGAVAGGWSGGAGGAGGAGGPNSERRARTSTYVIAIAYDAAGSPLSEVRLSGPNPYELTGSLLAWGAERAAAGGLQAAGAAGPVDAFGLSELEHGCAELGLVREA